MLLLLPLHSWHGLNWCHLIPPQPILPSTTLNSLKGFNMANLPLHQHHFAQCPVQPMSCFIYHVMQALPKWKLMMLLQNISFLICDPCFRIMSVVQEIVKALSQVLVVIAHRMKAVNFHLINSKYGLGFDCKAKGRSLHSPPFLVDSDWILIRHSDSTRTLIGLVHQPSTCKVIVPVPVQSNWSPSGVQIVLGIPRTSRSESTGSAWTTTYCYY